MREEKIEAKRENGKMGNGKRKQRKEANGVVEAGAAAASRRPETREEDIGMDVGGAAET